MVVEGTTGAKTRFIAPAYGKFESSSLQRRVTCELVFVSPEIERTDSAGC
jgi:hypothetical protein